MIIDMVSFTYAEILRPSGAVGCFKCTTTDDARCEREGTETNTKTKKQRDWQGESLKLDGFYSDCIGRCYVSEHLY